MSTPLGSMHIELGLDTSKFASNLNASKRAVQYFSSEARALDGVLKNGGKNLNALSAKYKALSQAFEKQVEVLKTLKERFDKIEPGSPEWERAATEIQKHNVKLENLRGQLTHVEEAIRKVHAENSKWGQASSALIQFGDKATEVGNKWKSAGDKISGIGNSLTKGVTVPLMTGAGLAIKSAIDFESAFAGVKKTVDETATISYAKLSRGIRDMSKELPASASEIANVAEAAGQLGVPAEAILGFTKNMINLGESTNMSAETAAMSIAKIGNIMGFTGTQLDGFSTQFGATVVRLGNNFATTENDITTMTNRLAASGRIAGLTTPQIMGLATSMSSVGIEAEAGGTAMSQTLTGISKAVSESGEELSLYAETAGMTAEQFAEAWKTKPAEAIQAFIKGLGEADSKGKDVNKILEDLGLTGIRQSGMLKSLGLSAETMGKAMKMAADEWGTSLGKTNALTEEASKRYETTGSKLKMLRNEATDVAIELGGPLVDALRDGLKAAKPLIAGAGELAKAFSSLDKKQQQQIIKWGLIAAGMGPVLSILGKTTSGVGTLMKVIGGTSTGLGKFVGWIAKLGASGKSIQTITTAATGASGALSGAGVAMNGVGTASTAMAGGLSLATLGWGALAVAGIAAIGTIAHFAIKVEEAHRRTQEWGTKVSETEAKELSQFKSKVDDTTKAMESFGGSAVKDVENVKKAFQGLVDEITALSDKELAKDLKLAEKWGLSDEQVQRMKSNATLTKENAQKMSDEVVQIYRNASENNRQLSAEEKEIVLNNQTELINKQLELMKFSQKERQAIQKAMNGEFDELNQEQLKKALNTTKKWLEEENKVYRTSKKELKELLKSGALTQSEYNDKMKALNAEHAANMEAYGNRYMAIRKKLAEGVNFGGNIGAEKAYWRSIEQEMDKLGLSYEELQSKMQSFADSAEQTSGLTAKSMANMSAEMEAANLSWNNLVLDPKTGQVKTNAREEIEKALTAEGGWESMKFTLKHANLESNAHMLIAEALQASGQWQGLSLEEKALVVDGKPAIAAIVDSETHLKIWNSLPADVKAILGNNENFMSNAASAKKALEQWNMMTPTQKALMAKNLTSADVSEAQTTINSLMGKDVSLSAKNETLTAVLEANQSINSPKQNAPISMFGRNDTGPAVAQANQAINSPRQKAPAVINATNNASGPAQQAKWDLDNVPRQIWSTITTVVQKIFKNEHGTDFHPGGLAMVNDQRGPLYKELITLPTGESFIPQGRDVILPLPRGSKVLTATRTKALMERFGTPRYAKGVGFPENSPFIKSLDSAEQQLSQQVTIAQDNSDVVALLKAILDQLKQSEPERMAIDVSGKISYSEQDRDNIMEAVMRALAQELQRKSQLRGVSL